MKALKDCLPSVLSAVPAVRMRILHQLDHWVRLDITGEEKILTSTGSRSSTTCARGSPRPTCGAPNVLLHGLGANVLQKFPELPYRLLKTGIDQWW